MSELFSIQLQNRQQQGRHGVWLDLPTTTEQVQAALRQIGISSDNPQGLFISGYFAEEEKRFAIPYNMVLASNVDELNFLAARLETLSAGERAELNAALQAPQSELSSIGKITDFPENVDYYVHLPDVRGPAQLGDYYLNRSGMVNMPDEWKGGIDTAQFGRYVAQQEQGVFTEYGYKSLHLSSVKDRFGIYALIDKNENRDKNICKPRASVRKQLSETKQATSPKKAAACSKQHEMEV